MPNNSNKYKITTLDIIKGIISIFICIAVAFLIYGFIGHGLLAINNFILEEFPRIIWILFFILVITLYGFAVGILKAIAGGFSTWTLLERYKKWNKD